MGYFEETRIALYVGPAFLLLLIVTYYYYGLSPENQRKSIETV